MPDFAEPRPVEFVALLGDEPLHPITRRDELYTKRCRIVRPVDHSQAQEAQAVWAARLFVTSAEDKLAKR
jgi:hypothetical protein